MLRRVAWVACQAVFLLAVAGGVALAVNDRRWILAVTFAYITGNVFWSLNWLPGQPGRLRRFLRRHGDGAKQPGQ